MNKAHRCEEVLNATLSALHLSLLRHMPAGPYRDFYLWAISSENLHRDTWLETTGIRQIAQLTVELLDGLLDDMQWEYARRYYPLLNVYFIYENMSDNLAIGLADPEAPSAHTAQRHRLISAFNSAMVDFSHNGTHRADKVLRPLYPMTFGISGFDQSLNRRKYLTSAQAFLDGRDDLLLEDLEYSLWPMLVANAEACKAVIQAINGQINPLLRTGLGNRYWSVNRQIDDTAMTLPEMVDIGTWGILVAPTLAYYSAILIGALHLDNNLSAVVENHTLESALYDAALLVRLLNDLGPLATVEAGKQKAMIDLLMARYRETPKRFRRIHDLLENTDEIRHLLPRIHKDIAHGEFNIALCGLANTSPASALLSLQSRLAYFSQVFALRHENLKETLVAISKGLEDDSVSVMIYRFVKFHQMLYGNAHTSLAGEYAV